MIKSSNIIEKKQTRSKIAPSSLCYFSMTASIVIPKKFYIWEKLYNELV